MSEAGRIASAPSVRAVYSSTIASNCGEQITEEVGKPVILLVIHCGTAAL